MAHQDLESDEGYHSSSDEDFAPNAAPVADQEDSASSSEDDDATHTERPRKRRKTRDDSAEALGYDNSGDEAIIKHDAKKKKKRGQSNVEDEDEGGEGGLIKTRAQRKLEARERKPLVEAKKAEVDVDALWAQMTGPKHEETNKREAVLNGASSSVEDAAAKSPSNGVSNAEPGNGASGSAVEEAHKTNAPAATNTVVIKRKYEFAGHLMEESKTVPIDSAEAKLYLQSQSKTSSTTNGTSQPTKSRPMKRRGLFGASNDKEAAPSPDKASTKLNTLEKSKLDWAAHVDKEDMSQELDEASRAKGAYLNRLDFLGRMDAKRGG